MLKATGGKRLGVKIKSIWHVSEYFFNSTVEIVGSTLRNLSRFIILLWWQLWLFVPCSWMWDLEGISPNLTKMSTTRTLTGYILEVKGHHDLLRSVWPSIMYRSRQTHHKKLHYSLTANILWLKHFIFTVMSFGERVRGFLGFSI